MGRYVVLYVENGLHGGGSAESLLQLLKVLDREKYSPIVVTTSRIPFVEHARRIGVDVIQLDNWYFSRQVGFLKSHLSWLATAIVVYGARWFPSLSLWMQRLFTASLRNQLQQIIQTHSVNLVHTNNNVHRDLWAIEAAGELGIPVVAHLRSFHAFGFSKVCAQIANKSVSTYIGYSRTIVEFWADCGLDYERMKIVHNAIGQVEAVSSTLEDIEIPGGVPTIGIIGRVLPERNHAFLIRAMPLLLKKIPELRLLIVGDGDVRDLEKLKKIANLMGVSDSVIFTGHRPDAQKIIAAIDAIVLPYTIEPFGRTLLEAWMLGTPVLLSRVGHITEIVTEGKDALLFGLDNYNELVDCVTQLLSNPKLYSELVLAGKDSCRRGFTIEAYCESINAIYENQLTA